eukprot:4942189-Prymnesium_polylepis.1
MRYCRMYSRFCSPVNAISLCATSEEPTGTSRLPHNDRNKSEIGAAMVPHGQDRWSIRSRK